MKTIQPQIFVLGLVQFIICIIGGLLVLSFTTGNLVPANVYVTTVEIGGLTAEQAVEKLKTNMNAFIDDVYIQIGAGNVQFKIMLSEIDATVDYDESIQKALGTGKKQRIENIIKGMTNLNKGVIYPVLRINEYKLLDKLRELELTINKLPVNADINIIDGEVVKTAEIPGVKLNIENTVKRIKDEIQKFEGQPIKFELSEKYELEKVIPQVTMQHFDGINEIISQYSTDITVKETEDSIIKASNSINKILIPPAEGDSGEFSFNKHPEKSNIFKEESDEGYNQVASTFYAAVLLAGIEKDEVIKMPHKEITEYILPGLDVCVGNNDSDLRFVNNTDVNLAVFSEVSNGKIAVMLAGNKKGNTSINNLNCEVVQKTDPPIVYIENSKLEKGQMNVISPGKPGMEVHTFRELIIDGDIIEKELISKDIYKPVYSIIQVAPAGSWENDGRK